MATFFDQHPTISIVTVCYNARDGIAKTIESVISQTNKGFEYIVVDGKSTDGTFEIIKKYQKKFPIVLISERDRGIYDAMNKGVSLAKGDYVNFMNAGDVFVGQGILEKVTRYLSEGGDFFYGATEFCYDHFSVVRKPRPLSDFWRKMPFNHQSLFAKTSLLKEHPFDLRYPMAADYESMVFFLGQHKKFREVPMTVAAFNNQGVSNQKGYRAIKEYKEILRSYHELTLLGEIYYDLSFIKILGKKIIPHWLQKFIYTHLVT